MVSAVDEETRPEVRQRLVEGWRAMPSEQKAALVQAWSADVRAVALAGVRERHPDATEGELRMRLGVLLYGEELIREAYGWEAPEAV